ncbi:glycosyltransferase [Thiorhodospira sibirica]|uniref:glycosyltransferase n=1 Tax=Thiorhodospira sibirica TaxID=154347 RepID=UPI00022C5E07|nr:glycosyltransferase [Thiorhodospira sibirica]
MKILMITDVYFPRINGVSTSIATFKQAFEAAGHQLTLIAPQYLAPYDDDAAIIRVSSRRVPFDPEDRMLKYREVLALAPTLAAEGYDILHIQTPFLAHYLGLKLARRLDIPCVESYHTYFEEYLFHYLPLVPDAWMRALARQFSRGQCNAVNAVIVPSRAMQTVLQNYGVATPQHVIPTGIPLELFAHGDGQAFRQSLGIAPHTPVLTHVGRIAHEKNVDFLLRVVQRIKAQQPDVMLLLTGEGPALAHIKQLAATLGLNDNIRFLGYLDRRTRLADCYAAGDVFIFASRTETQGLVLLESMAAGVPVVALSIMGTRDILEPGLGALVAQDDEADFARQVLTLLQDRALRERLSHEARDYATRWSVPHTAQQTLAVYAQCVAARR